LGWPTRKSADVDEERVIGLDVDLGNHLDAVDHVVVVGNTELGHPVEHLELDTALQQHLVERPEDGVAHSRHHLVGDRSLVETTDAHQRLDRLAGGQVGPVGSPSSNPNVRS
jgi:hypothetical protein